MRFQLIRKRENKAIANANMNPTTSSIGGGPSRYLEPQDLGLSPRHKISTICGNLLNSAATPSGVKNTVIGGIISINQTFYAMTSGRSLANAQRPYKVQFDSDKLDWALCEIANTLAVPNIYGSGPLLRYMQEEELEHTEGPVDVLVGFDSSYRAYLSHELGTTLGWFDQNVKVRTFSTSLPKTTKIRTGAWVVKGDSLCGYVVHSEPQEVGGNGRLGYMVPIWQAFKEIEAKTGRKVIFGQELHDMIERL